MKKSRESFDLEQRVDWVSLSSAPWNDCLDSKYFFRGLCYYQDAKDLFAMALCLQMVGLGMSGADARTTSCSNLTKGERLADFVVSNSLLFRRRLATNSLTRKQNIKGERKMCATGENSLLDRIG